MEQKETQESKEQSNHRIDILMLYNAKELNLSFKELNELRLKDLVAMLDIKLESFEDIGTDNNNKIKKANQSDIDSFLS